MKDTIINGFSSKSNFEHTTLNSSRKFIFCHQTRYGPGGRARAQTSLGKTRNAPKANNFASGRPGTSAGANRPFTSPVEGSVRNIATPMQGKRLVEKSWGTDKFASTFFKNRFFIFRYSMVVLVF